MQASHSPLPWSLEYVPPSADSLLSFDVEGLNLDIEEGLCCPSDQEVFLTASMAFLQNHLVRKLRNDIYSRFQRKLYKPQKTYSNLLLVETRSKFRKEKYFIKLKNIECYDEILKNEASLPNRTLSLNQILPSPKKTLWPSRRKFFRSKMSIPTSSDSQKSHGFFSGLKKTLFRRKVNPSLSSDEPDKKAKEMKLKQKRCQLYVNALPSRTSSLTTLGNFRNLNEGCTVKSLAVNRLKMAPSFINPWKFSSSNATSQESSYEIQSLSIEGDFSSPHCSKNMKLNLCRSELEILRWISGQPLSHLNQSLGTKIREIKTYYSHPHRDQDMCDYNASTSNYETLKFSSKSKVNVLGRCNAQTKLRSQQSKLSVFLEEGSISDDEELPNHSSVCSNLTDEFKSKFSTRYVPALIVRRVIDSSKQNY